MKQLFLTSSVHAVAHDIAKRVDLSAGNKLVFITTPADFEPGDKEWLRNDRQALIDAGFEVTDYTIVGKSAGELTAELIVYDFIYLSGGNTLYLLQESQKTGFITVIKDLIEKQGKIYIGTSAGSIIAGTSVPDYLEADEGVEPDGRDGYSFVNFTIVPHWGSDHFRERYLNKRLEMAYREDQVPLMLLTDNHYVHVQGSKIELINITR
jgi:dipeptidase E